MKGLYISTIDREELRFLGVYKKVQYQIDAFKNLGVDMDYIGLMGKNIEFINSKIHFNKKRLRQIMMFKKIVDNNKYIISNKYDFIYIRFSFANPYMFKLSRILKEQGMKIIIEIPTYPYEDEIKNSFKNVILKNIDRYLWGKNSKYIYRLVLTNDYNNLFGIKAINIFNGVSSREIKENTINNIKNEEINLIGVANISRWHGYDRIIRGLYEYYKEEKKYKINFYIIGEGAEKENLEKLSNELGVYKYVHLLGSRYGSELEELYDMMHIGVSSLALFRAGGGHDPIKSKEYLAKGLPVIIGYKDRALSSNLDFVYEVEANDSSIDLNKIIEKYTKSKVKNSNIIEYAKNNLTWDSQIAKIIKSINE